MGKIRRLRASIIRLPIASLSLGVLAIVTCASWPTAAADPQSPSEKPSAAAPAQKPDRPALEDALLKDLDNELLEGAGDLKGRPKTNSSADNPFDEKMAEDSETGDDVGAAGQDDDPLMHISREMRTVESLISRQTKAGNPEPIQRQILSDLEKLIEQMEKQSAAQQQSSGKGKQSQQVAKRQSVKQSKPSAAGGKPSTKPAQDSTDRLQQSQATRVDSEAVKGLLKDSWGNLPAKAREQMLQNPPEQFLPQYELMIEKYYKRLAEEQNSK